MAVAYVTGGAYVTRHGSHSFALNNTATRSAIIVALFCSSIYINNESNITYGGEALTYLGQLAGGDERIRVYYKTHPLSGNNTLACDAPSNCHQSGLSGAIFEGVSIAAPFVSTLDDVGTSSPVTIDSVTSGVIVAACLRSDANNIGGVSVAAPCTQIAYASDSHGMTGCQGESMAIGYKLSDGATTDFTFGGTCGGGIGLRPAAASDQIIVAL